MRKVVFSKERLILLKERGEEEGKKKSEPDRSRAKGSQKSHGGQKSESIPQSQDIDDSRGDFTFGDLIRVVGKNQKSPGKRARKVATWEKTIQTTLGRGSRELKRVCSKRNGALFSLKRGRQCHEKEGAPSVLAIARKPATRAGAVKGKNEASKVPCLHGITLDA